MQDNIRCQPSYQGHIASARSQKSIARIHRKWWSLTTRKSPIQAGRGAHKNFYKCWLQNHLGLESLSLLRHVSSVFSRTVCSFLDKRWRKRLYTHRQILGVILLYLLNPANTSLTLFRRAWAKSRLRFLCCYQNFLPHLPVRWQRKRAKANPRNAYTAKVQIKSE